jgi:hypothetical protein
MKNIVIGFLVGFLVGFSGVVLLVGMENVDKDTKIFGYIVGVVFGGICALIVQSQTKNSENE